MARFVLYILFHSFPPTTMNTTANRRSATHANAHTQPTSSPAATTRPDYPQTVTRCHAGGLTPHEPITTTTTADARPRSAACSDADPIRCHRSHADAPKPAGGIERHEHQATATSSHTTRIICHQCHRTAGSDAETDADQVYCSHCYRHRSPSATRPATTATLLPLANDTPDAIHARNEQQRREFYRYLKPHLAAALLAA